MFLGSSCCNIAENSTFARPLDFACRLNPSFHAFAEACATETLGAYKAKVLLADRGYDSDAIVEKAEKAGMRAVIPPRKNRKMQREYDKELYKLRHFVENAFMILKRWRGVATRYAKNTASFLAAVQIRCIAAWVF